MCCPFEYFMAMKIWKSHLRDQLLFENYRIHDMVQVHSLYHNSYKCNCQGLSHQWTLPIALLTLLIQLFITIMIICQLPRSLISITIGRYTHVEPRLTEGFADPCDLDDPWPSLISHNGTFTIIYYYFNGTVNTNSIICIIDSVLSKTWLTSTTLVTQVREPPDVTQAHGIADAGENEVQFSSPASSLPLRLSLLHAVTGKRAAADAHFIHSEDPTLIKHWETLLVEVGI